MNINFKNLLPHIMRDTKWGELVEVVQSVVQTIYDEKINPLTLLYNLQNTNTTEIKKIISFFGYPLLTAEGFTSSLTFLRRQLYSIIFRISNKNTKLAYEIIFKIFYYIGNVYPLVKESDYLIPDEYWWENVENLDTPTTLDAEIDNILYYISLMTDVGLKVDKGYMVDYMHEISAGKSKYLPQYLDTINLPFLDYFINTYNYTRHILISFTPFYIESESIWVSENTFKIFNNDCIQNKKEVEVLHYEINLPISINIDQTERIVSLTNYDKSINSSIISIININFLDLINFDYLILKNSQIEEQLIFEKENIKIINISNNNLKFRNKIYAKSKIISFDEIYLKNESLETLLYARFPKIEIPINIYTNIQININAIEE